MSILSLTAVGLGAVSDSEIINLYKSVPKTHPIKKNTIGMGVCAVMLFVTSQLMGERIIMLTESSTWMALVYLIIFGSIFAFVLAVVVKYWKASLAS